jgi:hypothetical protein
MVEELASGDDDQAKAAAIQILAPFDVMLPLLGVLGVLAPVVLDQQLLALVPEVEPSHPAAVRRAHDQVDPWLG